MTCIGFPWASRREWAAEYTGKQLQCCLLLTSSWHKLHPVLLGLRMQVGSKGTGEGPGYLQYAAD